MATIKRASSDDLALRFHEGMSLLESERSGSLSPINKARLQDITNLLMAITDSMGRNWSMEEEWEACYREEQSPASSRKLREIKLRTWETNYIFENSPAGFSHLKELGFKNWQEYYALKQSLDGMRRLRELELKIDPDYQLRGEVVRFIAENPCLFNLEKTDESLSFLERLRGRFFRLFRGSNAARSWEDNRLADIKTMCVAMYWLDRFDRELQQASDLERLHWLLGESIASDRLSRLLEENPPSEEQVRLIEENPTHGQLRQLIRENPESEALRLILRDKIPSEDELKLALQVFHRLKTRSLDKLWDYLLSFYRPDGELPELTEEAIQFLDVASRLLRMGRLPKDDLEDCELQASWLRIAVHLAISILSKNAPDERLIWPEPGSWQRAVEEQVQRQNEMIIDGDRELRTLNELAVAKNLFWTDALRNYFRYYVQREAWGGLESRSFPRRAAAQDALAAREVLESLYEISEGDVNLLDILQCMFSQITFTTLSEMLMSRQRQLEVPGVDLTEWVRYKQSIEETRVTKKRDDSFFVENYFSLNLVQHPDISEALGYEKPEQDPQSAHFMKITHRYIKITHTIYRAPYTVGAMNRAIDLTENRWRVSDPQVELRRAESAGLARSISTGTWF